MSGPQRQRRRGVARCHEIARSYDRAHVEKQIGNPNMSAVVGVSKTLRVIVARTTRAGCVNRDSPHRPERIP